MNFACAVGNEPNTGQFLKCLLHLADEAAAGHRHDDVLGRAPAKLLGDLESERLGAFRVKRP